MTAAAPPPLFNMAEYCIATVARTRPEKPALLVYNVPDTHHPERQSKTRGAAWTYGAEVKPQCGKRALKCCRHLPTPCPKGYAWMGDDIAKPNLGLSDR